MAAIGFVELAAVTAGYDRRAAIRSVSARFEAGTITCVEGPNGAGKSTLLAVIGTLLAPMSGRVQYGAEGLSRAAARREIGWLSHEMRMYRELTGLENVELAARLRLHQGTAKAGEICERLGAAGFADRLVSTLSRGQRQRIALCCAMVHDPSVLLLDEPQTGLDAEGVSNLVELIRSEAGRDRVTVIVNHAAGFAERVGALRLRLVAGRRQPPA